MELMALNKSGWNPGLALEGLGMQVMAAFSAMNYILKWRGVYIKQFQSFGNATL
jgi:hypothetical protein